MKTPVYTASMVAIQVIAVEEDTPVRGNALASGDDAADRACEDEILARLDSGDVWAWASVEVVASIIVNGVLVHAQEYLGCCSYEDERRFRRDGYCTDMIRRCLESLEKGCGVWIDEDTKRAIIAREIGGGQ